MMHFGRFRRRDPLTAFQRFQHSGLQEHLRQRIQCISVLTNTISQAQPEHPGGFTLRVLLQTDPLDQLLSITVSLLRRFSTSKQKITPSSKL